jgi:hypothetical protein
VLRRGGAGRKGALGRTPLSHTCHRLRRLPRIQNALIWNCAVTLD